MNKKLRKAHPKKKTPRSSKRHGTKRTGTKRTGTKRTVKRTRRVLAPLLAVRKRKKMSRPALSKKSGLSQECIRNIEIRGASPQLRTLQTLAKALSVPVAKLIAA